MFLEISIPDIYYYNLTNSLPLDLSMIGILILLGFAFVLWRSGLNAPAAFPLILIMLYAIWQGTRIFPFNALLLLSTGLIAVFLLIGLMKLGEKQHFGG